MDVILLERVEKLGAIGDVVTVKNGYARNFLLPRKKALRANAANKKVFEANRAQIEADNAKRRETAVVDRRSGLVPHRRRLAGCGDRAACGKQRRRRAVALELAHARHRAGVSLRSQVRQRRAACPCRLGVSLAAHRGRSRDALVFVAWL